VPDYSEFPTTPTAWQEKAWADVAPLALEDTAPPPRRGLDLPALVAGVVFVVVALVSLAGLALPFELVADGGLLWLFLIGAGVALLVSEVRRARRRQG
jgi:hypothetical protein